MATPAEKSAGVLFSILRVGRPLRPPLQHPFPDTPKSDANAEYITAGQTQGSPLRDTPSFLS